MVTKGTYNAPITIHPGETVREHLEMIDMSQSELSIRSGLSRKTVNQILQGEKPITPKSALIFDRVLGISKEGLLNMQALFDVDVLKCEEEKKMKEDIAIMKTFDCYAALAKYGCVEKTLKPKERVEELMRFFSVSSLDLIQKMSPVHFRRLETKKVSEPAVFSWLRIGYIEAMGRVIPVYDRKKLVSRLSNIRALTVEDPKKYSEKLVEILAECGVVLVYTPYLSRTYINGVTRWITPTKPLIQISLRGASADAFWFTLFHEIGHVLKHNKEIFVDWQENGSDLKVEKEANIFAQKQLFKNEKKYQELKSRLSDENMHILIPKFAKEEGIDQGIVAGRFAKETNQWKKFASFRKYLKFEEEKAN